ncbi:MAG: DUF4190 domain-containing protein [Chloroflexi bacterium]|nr:DUF4190 domain-containing protein [Chloroflexota bacterium]
MIPSTVSTKNIQAGSSANRLALVSFLFAALTFSSFCIGLLPIPLSAWVCYPAAILLGSAALLTGFRALQQLRARGQKGRGMALVGIWTGALTILAVLCATTLTFVFFFYGADYMNRLWLQLKP